MSLWQKEELAINIPGSHNWKTPSREWDQTYASMPKYYDDKIGGHLYVKLDEDVWSMTLPQKH